MRSSGEGEGEENLEISPTAIEWIYQQVNSGNTVQGTRTLKYFVVSVWDQDGVNHGDLTGGDAKAAVQAVFIY